MPSNSENRKIYICDGYDIPVNDNDTKPIGKKCVTWDSTKVTWDTTNVTFDTLCQ